FAADRWLAGSELGAARDELGRRAVRSFGGATLAVAAHAPLGLRGGRGVSPADRAAVSARHVSVHHAVRLTLVSRAGLATRAARQARPCQPGRCRAWARAALGRAAARSVLRGSAASAASPLVLSGAGVLDR